MENLICCVLMILFLVGMAEYNQVDSWFKPIINNILKRLGFVFYLTIFVCVLPIVYTFLQTICWLIINTLELLLIIPFFIIWLLTGTFYGYRLQDWINDRTGLFNSMYDTV